MRSLPGSSPRPTAPALPLQARSTAGPWRSSTSSSHAAGTVPPSWPAAPALECTTAMPHQCAVDLACRSYDINVTPDKRKALLHREQDVLDAFQEVSAVVHKNVRPKAGPPRELVCQPSLDCCAGPHKDLGSGAWSLQCDACHGHPAAQEGEPGPCRSFSPPPAGAGGVH